jgi:hypothetical protein
MPKKKRHHYIPVMHLKHFVGNNPAGQIWTIEKETGIARSSAPEETGFERYFYGAEQDDGSHDTKLEEFLANVEGIADRIYERMVSGSIPGPDKSKGDFSAFLAFMYLRTPAMRRDAAEAIGRDIQRTNYEYGADDQKFEDAVRRMEETRGRAYSPDEKTDLRKWLVDPSHYVLQVTKERTFAALAYVKDLAPIFFRMHWSLVEPKHGFFITSDNPVVRLDQRLPIEGNKIGSSLDAWSEVSFPLTPKLLLLMTKDPEYRTDPIERDRVWAVNKMRASFADRYIYSHINRKDLRDLAMIFNGSRPKFSEFDDRKTNSPIAFTKTEVPRRRPRPGSRAATWKAQ